MDDSVPVWWSDYRTRWLMNEKLTGAGSEKNRDRGKAAEKALEAAKRDLGNWIKNRIESITTWYATTYERQNERVTGDLIHAVVGSIVDEYVDRCKLARSYSARRSDGRIEVYSLVEVSARELLEKVSKALIERISEGEPRGDSDQIAAEIEGKVRDGFGFPGSGTGRGQDHEERIASLITEIRAGIDSGTRESLDSAEAGLVRLESLDPQNSELSGLQYSWRSAHNQMSQVGQQRLQEEADNPLIRIMGRSPVSKVIMETTMGNLEIELIREKAPITVDNFLQYAEESFYDGTVFHRVIDGFVIQGGGYTTADTKKETRDPIVLESNNGLSNLRGTIAMARARDSNSATSQFFINVVDNIFLDGSPGNPGYAVFGKVTRGMDVVDAIKSVRTGRRGPFPADCPVKDIIIRRISIP